MRARKPWVRARFKLLGWNVRFMSIPEKQSGDGDIEWETASFDRCQPYCGSGPKKEGEFYRDQREDAIACLPRWQRFCSSTVPSVLSLQELFGGVFVSYTTVHILSTGNTQAPRWFRCWNKMP